MRLRGRVATLAFLALLTSSSCKDEGLFSGTKPSESDTGGAGGMGGHMGGQQAAECPDGWTEVTDGNCYQLFSERTTYDAARSACQGEGDNIDLATLADQAELDVATELVMGTGTGPWLGGRSEGDDCNFVWEPTGEPWNWPGMQAPWSPGQPDSCAGEHCVHLYGTGELNNRPCESTVERICELTR